MELQNVDLKDWTYGRFESPIPHVEEESRVSALDQKGHHIRHHSRSGDQAFYQIEALKGSDQRDPRFKVMTSPST